MEPHNTLYISDLDGTLLRDDQSLCAETVQFLSNAINKGLQFTYATARSITSSQFVLDQLNIQLPVILYNGAQIYCPKQTSYIHTAYMEANCYLEHLKALQELGLAPVVHCMDADDNLKVYFQSASNESTAKWINSRLQNGDKRFRVTTDFSEVKKDKVIELMVVGQLDALTHYQDALDSEPAISYVLSEDIYCKGYYWLEINHVNANKGYAAQKLSEHLGLSQIVSFGDNHNDIPMFKISAESFAVSNAADAVQSAASSVIDSNNENAVSRYLSQV